MIEADRLVAAAPVNPQEEVLDRTLRPRALERIHRPGKIRGQFSIFIEAAKSARSRSITCCCSVRRASARRRCRTSSRTSSASTCARPRARCWSAPAISRRLLTNLEPNDVLFIDEIHRLSPVVEEILYPALEDFQIDIMIGEGPAARSVKLDLQPFTLVGATTRAGMLTNPLRDRFGIVARLEFYSAEELTRIVTRSARLLEIAHRARGRGRDRAPLARHAAHRQPASAPGARFRRGSRRRT